MGRIDFQAFIKSRLWLRHEAQQNQANVGWAEAQSPTNKKPFKRIKA